MDRLCSCGNDIESTIHFFLHCANLTTQRQTLLNKLKSIYASILAENENLVVRTLLFGRPNFTYSTNKEIINATKFNFINRAIQLPSFLKLINSSKSEALQSPPDISFHFSLFYLRFNFLSQLQLLVSPRFCRTVISFDLFPIIYFCTFIIVKP